MMRPRRGRVPSRCVCCRAECWLGRIPRIVLEMMLAVCVRHDDMSSHIPVSPASPLYAIRVCLFSDLVLSSWTLRTVGPRITAFEAAMMVKSLPVIPSKTSLYSC